MGGGGEYGGLSRNIIIIFPLQLSFICYIYVSNIYLYFFCYFRIMLRVLLVPVG